MKIVLFTILTLLTVASCSDDKNRYHKHIKEPSSPKTVVSKDVDIKESDETSTEPIETDETSLYITVVVDRIDANGYAWCGPYFGINKLTNGLSKKYEIGDTLVIQIQ